MTNTTTKPKTKPIDILACALALLAVSPAAGFTQRDADPPSDVHEAVAVAPPALVPDAEHTPSDETTLGGESPVSVVRLLVAKDVSDREPVGAATEFSIADTSHLFAFVEVSNSSGEATTVTVSWIDGSTDQVRRSYELEVGPHKRWRTWARMAAPKQPGSWSVALSDELSGELASIDFAMVE